MRRNVAVAGLAIALIALVCIAAGFITVEKTKVLSSASTTTILRRKVFSKSITPARDYLIEGSFQSSALIDFAVMTEDQYSAWGRVGHPKEGTNLKIAVLGDSFSFNARKGTKYRLVFVNYHYYSVSLSTSDLTGKYSEPYSTALGVLGIIGLAIGAVVGIAGYRMKPPAPEVPPQLQPPPAYCPKCGALLSYTQETEEWYCPNCKTSVVLSRTREPVQ